MKAISDFYKKNELAFAIILIVIYCVVFGSLRGNFGDSSIICAAAIAALAVFIWLFVKINSLEGKYGLDRWPSDWEKYLWFIPMWIMTSGNLWGGVSFRGGLLGKLFALITMALVGFVEEMLFRGFLYKAMIPSMGVKKATIVAALTFAAGHIINLLNGHQDILATLLQIVFAAAVGFVFTMAYLKSGSLRPVIIAHSLIDMFSVFARYSRIADWAYIIASIVLAALYCPYLAKLEDKALEK